MSDNAQQLSRQLKSKENELAKLKQDHAAETTKKQQEHAKAIQSLQGLYESQKRLAEDANKKITTLTTTHKDAMAKLVTDNQQKMDALLQKHMNELAEKTNQIKLLESKSS